MKIKSWWNSETGQKKVCITKKSSPKKKTKWRSSSGRGVRHPEEHHDGSKKKMSVPCSVTLIAEKLRKLSKQWRRPLMQEIHGLFLQAEMESSDEEGRSSSTEYLLPSTSSLRHLSNLSSMSPALPQYSSHSSSQFSVPSTFYIRVLFSPFFKFTIHFTCTTTIFFSLTRTIQCQLFANTVFSTSYINALCSSSTTTTPTYNYTGTTTSPNSWI